MAPSGFHSVAKLRAQIFNPAMADRGVLFADCHNENGRSADCQSLKSTFESGLPQVWTLRRVHIRSEGGGWRSAAQLRADCQAIIPIASTGVELNTLLERGKGSIRVYTNIYGKVSVCLGWTQITMVYLRNLLSISNSVESATHTFERCFSI
jgi:hypothetical protein